jgi:hypothetical protein
MFLEVNENENMTYQNLWDTAKEVLRGKFIAISVYLKRTERYQINDLMIHLTLLEKQEQVKPKWIRKREIIKIRAKINEIEIKKKHTKNQWNRKLVLWKNKQEWQTPGKSDYNEDGKDPNR